MNKKLIIRNTANEILQTAIFNDQQILDDFLNLLATQHPYGKPAHDEILEDESIIHHEAEYTTEVVDISIQIAQEQINKEALQYLADTDWKVIKAVELGLELDPIIKQLRQEARNKVI